jgi:hypothetical protein
MTQRLTIAVTVLLALTEFYETSRDFFIECFGWRPTTIRHLNAAGIEGSRLSTAGEVGEASLLLGRNRLPRRRSRLQGAVRDHVSFSSGRWSIGLPFRSVDVPEALDQSAPCEGICEIRWVHHPVLQSHGNSLQSICVEGDG